MRPRVRVLLRVLAATLLAAGLAACSGPADVAESHPPTLAPVLEEIREYNTCMTDKGWQPSATYEDGSFGFSFPDAQRERFADDNAACIEHIGANELPDWTEGQWRAYYEQLVAQAACLEQQGLQPSDPPSFGVWTDTDRAWSPYADIPRDLVLDRLDGTRGSVSNADGLRGTPLHGPGVPLLGDDKAPGSGP